MQVSHSKLGEYEMWVIRIKQYFQIQDYALWEVIENGDSWVSVPHTSQENGITVTKMSTPATVEEKTNKKNDVKARGLLLMALPNEHQLTFSQYLDAKSMFAAIETRFGVQQVQRVLDSIFNRLQKIVSRLAILGVIIAQEDLNLKFLSSLPPEWNTHVVVWMNKPEVETMSIDDLYNNFKIVEQKDLEQIHEDDLEAMDLKWQLSLLSVRAKKYYQRTSKKIFINANDIAGYDKSKGFDWSDMTEEQVQSNMALMAFSDSVSFLEVYTDKTCSKTCLKNYETLKKQCDDLLVKLNESEFKATTYKRGLATIEAQLITYKKNEVLFSEEVAVLKREVGCKNYEINVLKSELEKVKKEKDGIDFKIEKFDKASKDLDQLLGSQITDKSKKGLGYSAIPPPHPLIYNRPNKLDLSYSGLDEFKEPEFKGYGPENSKQESNVVCEKESENSKENSDESLVEEQVTHDKSSFVESSPNVDKETIFPANKKGESEELEWIEINCHNHQIRDIVSRNNYNRVDAKNTHPNVLRNMSPKAVLMKTGLTLVITVRLVNTAHPKTAVHSAKSKTHFSKQAQSTAKRPFYKQTTLTRRSVHEVKRHYYTGRHYAVNTARASHNMMIKDLLTVDAQAQDGKSYLSDCIYFDMKNIVPKESLTYLVAKATLDESMFWHRILGHITFENINKLVKDNLVRGLPTKRFENDQTCVACLKGKQTQSTCKFDGKSDEGFFVGYSLSSKSFRVYNTRTKRVEENLHIRIHTFDSPTKDVDNGEPKTADDAQKQVEDSPNNENAEQERFADDSSTKDVNAAGQQVNTASPDVNTGSLKLNTIGPSVSTTSPNEEDSIEEEPKVDLGNLTNSYIVLTTPNTRIHKDHLIDNVIGEVQSTVQTRRMSKPTLNKGFHSIDASWVEAMTGRTSAIQTFNSFGILDDLPNGKKALNKMGFKDPDHPDKVYKVVKALYGLHQAPRAWITSTIEGRWNIYQSQDKYVAEILKKFNYSDVKSALTPVDLEKPLVKDGDADDVDVHLYRSMIGSLMYLTASRPDIMFADSPIELVAYTDSDYAGATQDGKSTTGGCQFLGNRLISWQCKKQTVVATFITEAEYVAAASCCGQVKHVEYLMLNASPFEVTTQFQI
ncbi:putative ribonuclease H-like domain-containing protein [Tanacetum coccineum]